MMKPASLSKWLPFHKKTGAESDSVAEKLKDFRLGEPEDEESIRRPVAGQAAAQDELGATVYRARLQNPFSKDF
jgi:hypothetical protein